jgi:hypothetical protein
MSLCKKVTFVLFLLLTIVHFRLITAAATITTDWDYFYIQPDSYVDSDGCIWGFSPNNFYIAGYPYIHHFNGVSWDSEDTAKFLNAIWGSSENNVFAVGDDGVILHYNGTT